MFVFNENANPYKDTWFTVQKFGRIPDIDSGDTNEDVWDGEDAYPFPAAAATMLISSSSAADDGAPVGTGALTIHVYGLIVNAAGLWVENDEIVTLNGQSGVSLASDYIRVYRAHLETTGTGNTNAGDIYIGTGVITAGVPAVVYLKISAGLGQTLMAIYTTPEVYSNGQTAEKVQLLRWFASIGAAQNAFATIAIQANISQNGWRTLRTGVIAEGGDLDQEWTFGQSITPKTDMRLRVLTNGVNNSSVSGGFDVRMR